MQHQIITSIVIRDTPENVWKTLIDFNQYPQWNPFITSIKGGTFVGNKLRVTIGNMKFRPKLIMFKTHHGFSWLGRLIIPGIFDGKHSFLLSKNQDGTTTFVQKEEFKGLLVPFMKKKLNNEIREGFNTMNRKLKEEVEKLVI